MVKVKEPGLKNFIKGHIAVVAINNLSLRLKRTYHAVNTSKLLFAHLCRLVYKHNVAELNLLYKQVLNIVFIKVRVEQGVAALKLILHTQSVNHGYYAVNVRYAAFYVIFIHLWNGADGLRYRGWLTNAACLYNYVVKTSEFQNACDLLH